MSGNFASHCTLLAQERLCVFIHGLVILSHCVVVDIKKYGIC